MSEPEVMVIMPEICKVNLGPDDLLVFKLLSNPTDAEIHAMKHEIERLIPNVRYVILTGGDDISVIHEEKATP